eukprot:12715577-Alexandrium_andersonii.AAC.1
MGSNARAAMFLLCPMRGKRAPELAGGALPRVLSKLTDIGIASVLVHTAALEDIDKQRILEDWRNGCAFVTDQLTRKMAFWQVLPWKLAGLMHHEPEVRGGKLEWSAGGGSQMHSGGFRPRFDRKLRLGWAGLGRCAWAW